VIADLADLEEVFDFELVDRIEGHARGPYPYAIASNTHEQSALINFYMSSI
jgi:hypothetical protein